MRRILTTITVFLLISIASNNAFAHSHFKQSNPADGDIITVPLNEIVLEFDGQIEQGSLIDIVTLENESVNLQEIIVNGSTLTAVLTEQLPNNEYQVRWNIISADGHPLEGEFTFTMDAEVQSSEFETEKVENEETVIASSEIETKEKNQETEQLTEDEESSSMILFVIVALAIILIIIYFMINRRKR